MRQGYVRKPLDMLTSSHINHLTQDWYADPDHFPDFILEDR